MILVVEKTINFNGYSRIEGGIPKVKWNNLLSNKRLAPEPKDPKEFSKYPISNFERDYEIIVSNASFRSLQDKTQVYPLAKSDFVRTRLTHSLEVSSIARQLGIMCFQSTSNYNHIPVDKEEKDVPDNDTLNKLEKDRVYDVIAILSCAGLLHDIGNPPFGHVGEEIIRSWFKTHLNTISVVVSNKGNGGEYIEMMNKVLSEQMKKDLLCFDGNAQTLRILGKAQVSSELNLPFSIISTLIKYPVESIDISKNSPFKKKVGTFFAEKEIFEDVVSSTGTKDSNGNAVRNPLTFLLEAADDIAYLTADIEDAVNVGLLTTTDIIEIFEKKINSNNKAGKYGERYAKKLLKELTVLEKSGGEKAVIINMWCNYLKRWLLYVSAYRFSRDYNNIMSGKCSHDMLTDNNYTFTVEILRDIMKQKVYKAKLITEPEFTAQIVISGLLDYLVPVIVNTNLEDEIWDRDPVAIIPHRFIEEYRLMTRIKPNMSENEKIYRRILIVTDYICSLTDGMAKAQYRKIMGID